MKLDSFEEVKKAYETAQTQWHSGDLRGAYDLLLEVFTTRLLSSHLIDADVKVMQSLADLAGLFGEFQGADHLLQGAISLYEAANSQYWADYTRLRRIQLSLDRGYLYQAQEWLQEMAPRIGDIEEIQFTSFGLLQWEESRIWINVEPQEQIVLFVELYLAMGRLLCSLGQYGQALESFKRGLFHTEGTEIPSLTNQTIVPFKLAIASAHLEKGDLTEADICLSTIEDQLERHQHPEYYIQWLEISGKLNLLRGEFGKGLEQFKQVRATCRQFGVHRAELRSTLNLAYVLILLNQTSKAHDYLVEAKVDASTLQDKVLASRVELLLRLVNARNHSLVVGNPITVSEMRKKTNDKLDSEDEEVKLDLRNSPNYLTLFEDRSLAFQWQLGDLNLGTANALLKQIKTVFQDTDSCLIKSQIQILEGIFAYYQGMEKGYLNRDQTVPNIDNLRDANKFLGEACVKLEEIGLKPLLWQTNRILGWCRTYLNYPTDELEALTESTNRLLSELTESLTDEDRAIYLINKWTADEEYMAARINQLQQLKQRLSRSPFWLKPWLYLSLIQRLDNLIKHIDRYKDVLVKRTIKEQNIKVHNAPSSFSFWRHIIFHPQKRVTLSFLLLPDRIFVVRFWRFFCDFVVIPTTRLEVRNTVQKWHEKIKGINGGRDLSIIPDDDSFESVMATVTSESQNIANHLATILKIPLLLQKLPKKTKALIIVPDDILHGFPFAIISHQNKYLVENYALSIAYELSGIKSTKSIFKKPYKPLIVGVSQGTNQFPPLPAVREEINQVIRWLQINNQKNLCTLTDNLANKPAVLKGLSEASFLHMACHGTFESNRPDQSGLVLISNNGKKEILSLRELSNLDLTRLKHATLSSCWSADHFILPGRWIISVPETLWRSGTQSILACLWEVYDPVAVSFMTRFYYYLNRYPRDEALRRTQLECIECRLPNCHNIDTSNPLFWAGFNLYGDYRFLNTRFLQKYNR